MARKTNTIKVKNDFYIVTNGKETEKNYFELLKAYRSMYDVHVEFQNADPLGLVDYVIKNISGANQVWIVFDIDFTHDHNRLIPAIKKAEVNGIKYAFSNVCFEVWLVSHFESIEKEMTEEKLEALLTKHLSSKKSTLIYSKNDRNLLKEYFVPDYKKAIENAKIVYQKRNLAHLQECGDNSRAPIWKWNSCTNVFMLVEALKLQKNGTHK